MMDGNDLVSESSRKGIISQAWTRISQVHLLSNEFFFAHGHLFLSMTVAFSLLLYLHELSCFHTANYKFVIISTKLSALFICTINSRHPQFLRMKLSQLINLIQI